LLVMRRLLAPCASLLLLLPLLLCLPLSLLLLSVVLVRDLWLDAACLFQRAALWRRQSQPAQQQQR
jgi:hypothetical protein